MTTLVVTLLFRYDKLKTEKEAKAKAEEEAKKKEEEDKSIAFHNYLVFTVLQYENDRRQDQWCRFLNPLKGLMSLYLVYF